MREKDNRLCSKNISTKHLTYSPNDAAKPRGGREFPTKVCKEKALAKPTCQLFGLWK